MGKDISGRIKVASLETMPHCSLPARLDQARA